jgi:hypothetical protein
MQQRLDGQGNSWNVEYSSDPATASARAPHAVHGHEDAYLPVPTPTSESIPWSVA